MKRTVTIAFLLAAAALPATAGAALYYGFTIGVTNAPPAPVIKVVEAPHMACATDAMVYVVSDDDFDYDGDLFRYGQYWFVYRSGYWYRARTHRGPYAVIDVRKVPRAILGVPKNRWKHHPLGGPPGQMKKQRQAVVVDVEDNRGHKHGRGK